MATLSSQDWRAILEPGERILWQGAPENMQPGGATMQFWLIFGAIFGIVGAVFLVVGIIIFMDTDKLLGAIFAGAGLVSLLIGLGAIIVPRRKERQRIARLRYALTDRRAVLHDREVTSFWITPDMKLDYQPGNPPSLWFDEVDTNLMVNNRVVRKKVGFANISEAPNLVQRIRDLQSQLPDTVGHGG